MADHMHRAHHVGSLLRPAALREAWRNADSAGLGQAQDEAIRDVVAMQERLGLRVVTDGEFRRLSYWNRFVEQVEGLEVGDARFSFTDESGDRLAFTAPHVTGKVRRAAPISGHEVEFVRSITDRDIKVTLPSPSTMQFWFGPLTGAYESSSAFFDDLALVYQQEIADLAQRAPRSSSSTKSRSRCCATRQHETWWPPRVKTRSSSSTTTSRRSPARCEGAPASVTTAMHVCRGQLQGPLDGERRL